MTLIDWKEDFALGIPAIDHEHREMIELINQTYRAVGEGKGGDLLGECLGEIYARISAHFALEERIMRERGYDEYADHKADHERLLDEILEIMDHCEDGRGFDEEGFAETLRNWFALHFSTRDARLHRHLDVQ